jgi:hypothetical protein
MGIVIDYVIFIIAYILWKICCQICSPLAFQGFLLQAVLENILQIQLCFVIVYNQGVRCILPRKTRTLPAAFLVASDAAPSALLKKMSPALFIALFLMLEAMDTVAAAAAGATKWLQFIYLLLLLLRKKIHGWRSVVANTHLSTLTLLRLPTLMLGCCHGLCQGHWLCCSICTAILQRS